MITNAVRQDRPGDLVIPRAETRGLMIPSKIKTAKIETVGAADALRIGHLDPTTWNRVAGALRVALLPA